MTDARYIPVPIRTPEKMPEINNLVSHSNQIYPCYLEHHVYISVSDTCPRAKQLQQTDSYIKQDITGMSAIVRVKLDRTVHV